MPDFSQFLFFDLEYNPGSSAVREYGYVLGEEMIRAKSPAKLEDAAARAKYIVGHNVLRHDAPILRQYFSIDFPNIKALDTLMLSTLLFPREPYHKLRKEYLQNENAPSRQVILFPFEIPAYDRDETFAGFTEKMQMAEEKMQVWIGSAVSQS